MIKNSIDKRKVTFEIEPKQNFHFRYKSELDMSHGVINGQVDGSFPKIILNLPPNNYLDEFGNKRNFFVLCTLHCFVNGKVLSPHLLLRKEEIEPNYKLIFEEMKDDNDYPLKKWWELKEYVIVRLPERDYRTSFENKMFHFNSLSLPLQFSELLGNIGMNDARSVKNSGEVNVCLGVTIFERNFYENTYSLYEKTCFSCNIFNGDDLRIHQICNTKGSVDGGTRVTLLIKLSSKLPIQIGIKKIHAITKLTEWSEVVNIDSKDIFGNHAITFCMPAYRGPPYDKDEIDVDLCVIVNRSTYKSNSVKFHYLNTYENHLARKRLRVNNESEKISKDLKSEFISRDSISKDVMPEINKLHLNDEKMNIKRSINHIYEMITSGKEIDVDDHITLADLISFDNCIHLYKLCANAQFRNFVINLRNKHHENLLHIACKYDNFKLIAPLIGMGCCMNEQDVLGRTPLHIAIDKKHKSCIFEVQKIMQKISLYSSNVKESFVKMLKAYDENGYTVLHTATLGCHYELLENLLKFCIRNDVNILDYGTLQNGDSIGHLMLKNDLMQLMPLLQEYVPDFRGSKNFDGETVKDIMEHKALSK